MFISRHNHLPLADSFFDGFHNVLQPGPSLVCCHIGKISRARVERMGDLAVSPSLVSMTDVAAVLFKQSPSFDELCGVNEAAFWTAGVRGV